MTDNPESACPVDHKARDAWLAQARAAEASKTQAQAFKPQPAQCPVDHAPRPTSWTQSLASYLPWSSARPDAAAPSAANPNLDTNRVVSSIPRSAGGPEACPVEHGASANAEIESGVDASGNWVYPSERMFFEAMKRKGYDARVADMKTVVPIHNAVNERAWQQIQEWEAPYLQASKCVPCLSSAVLRWNVLDIDCQTQMRRPQARILRQQNGPHDAHRAHQHHPRLHRAV